MSWDFLLDVIKNGFDRRNRRNGRGTPNMLNQAPIGWKTNSLWRPPAPVRCWEFFRLEKRGGDLAMGQNPGT